VERGVSVSLVRRRRRRRRIVLAQFNSSTQPTEGAWPAKRRVA
jgi:hypothetical protein